MINMRCNDARAMMSEALDGCLDDKRRSAVDKHMQTCAACRERWRTMQHVSDIFQSADLAAPSPGFTLRLMQQLGKQGEQRPSYTHGGSSLALAWGAAAGVVLIGLTLIAVALTSPANTSAGIGPALDFLALSLRISTAAIHAAAVTESVLGVTSSILRGLPPAVIALVSVWLLAGTAGLALTVAGAVAGYQPEASRSGR